MPKFHSAQYEFLFAPSTNEIPGKSFTALTGINSLLQVLQMITLVCFYRKQSEGRPEEERQAGTLTSESLQHVVLL